MVLTNFSHVTRKWKGGFQTFFTRYTQGGPRVYFRCKKEKYKEKYLTKIFFSGGGYMGLSFYKKRSSVKILVSVVYG